MFSSVLFLKDLDHFADLLLYSVFKLLKILLIKYYVIIDLYYSCGENILRLRQVSLLFVFVKL